MMTTNYQSNGRGVVNHAVIRVIEDEAKPVQESFVVGFKPRVIRIHNVDNGTCYEWLHGMADGSCLVSSGSLDLKKGPTVNNGGFSVPPETMVANGTFQIEVIG